MQLRSLEYLIEIEKAGSINKASRNLFISQQGLRSVLDSMEAELGVKLVERSHRGIAFTEEGQAVLERAHRIVDEYALLQQDVAALAAHEHAQDATSTVNLVVSTYVSLTLLSRLLPFDASASVLVHEWGNDRIKGVLLDERLCQASSPQVSASEVAGFQAAEAQTPVAQGASGRLFLFDWVSSDPVMRNLTSDVAVRRLFESHLGLICRAESKVGRMDSLSLADLSGISLACFSGRDYLQTMDEAFGFGALPDALLKVSDPQAISSFLSSNSEAGIVADELSFSGRHLDPAAREPGLAFVPLKESAALVVGFAYAASDPQADAYERFVSSASRRLGGLC